MFLKVEVEKPTDRHAPGQRETHTRNADIHMLSQVHSSHQSAMPLLFPSRVSSTQVQRAVLPAPSEAQENKQSSEHSEDVAFSARQRLEPVARGPSLPRKPCTPRARPAISPSSSWDTLVIKVLLREGGFAPDLDAVLLMPTRIESVFHDPQRDRLAVVAYLHIAQFIPGQR